MIYACTCLDCGETFKAIGRNRLRCGPCGKRRSVLRARQRRLGLLDPPPPRTPDARWATLAVRFVVLAKELGVLPGLNDPDIRCVDCGAVANEYDHRDYSRPLEVDPVCGRCNKLRGPAKAPTLKQQKKGA